MSLRVRLMLGVGLLTLVILSILGVASIQHMHGSLQKEVASRADATHEILASQVADALISFDLARVDSILDRLAGSRRLAAAGVQVGEQWISFAGTFNDDTIVPDANIQLMSDPFYTSARELTVSDQTYGTVYLAFDLSDVRSDLVGVIVRFSTIAAMGFLTAVGLSVLVARWLTQRTRRLTQVAQRLGKGELNVVMVDSGNDEFSELSRSFNAMAERLRSEANQREQALKQAKENEIDLLQRTQQVETYNQMSNLLNVVQLNVILNPGQPLFSQALTQDLADITHSQFAFIAQIDPDAEQPENSPLTVVSAISRNRDPELQSWIDERLAAQNWVVNWAGDDDDISLTFETVGRYLSGHDELVNEFGEKPFVEWFNQAALVPLFHRGNIVALFGMLRSGLPYEESLEHFLQPLVTTCSQLADARSNVVARIEAENSLRASEAKIRSVLESASDGIVTLTANGVIATANRAAGEVFGGENEALIGLWFGELLDPETRQLLSDGGVAALLAAESSSGLSVKAVQLGGQDVPVEMTLSPMDLEGEDMFTVVVRDVTDKIRAQEALKAHSEQLDSILSLSPDGFLATTARGVVTYANPALERLLGINLSQSGALTLSDVNMRLSRNSDDWHYLLEALKAGETYALHMTKPSNRFLEISAAEVTDQDQELLGRVFYMRDVTHQTEVDRMKSEFLSTAAHELRTPLASVYGFSELLMNIDYPKEMRDDMLETIHKQASRLTTLIDELLDLARIEARAGKDFDIQVQDLHKFLEQIASSFVMVDDERELQYDLPEELPEVAYDDNKLAQAVNNILSNAFKYSPDGGAPRLGVSVEDGRVGIWAQDQGIGMTKNEVERVYDRFFRADPSCNIPGTGLGMSVVKEIVDLHQGEISIDSEPGVGTRVTLWLPTVSDRQQVAS